MKLKFEQFLAITVLTMNLLSTNNLTSAMCLLERAESGPSTENSAPVTGAVINILFRTDGQPIKMGADQRIHIGSPSERAVHHLKDGINDYAAKNIGLPATLDIVISPDQNKGAMITDADKLVVFDGVGGGAAEFLISGSSNFKLDRSYGHNKVAQIEGKDHSRYALSHSPASAMDMTWAPSGEFIVVTTNNKFVKVIFVPSVIEPFDDGRLLNPHYFSSNNPEKQNAKLADAIAVEVVSYKDKRTGKNHEYILTLWNDNYFSIHTIGPGNGFGPTLHRKLNEIVPAGDILPEGASLAQAKKMLKKQFDTFYRNALDMFGTDFNPESVDR